MNPVTVLPAVLLAAAAPAAPADSPAPAPTYADLADLALAAPVVAQVRTLEAIPVKDADAAGLRPGFARLYVQAEVTALIRAAGPVPSRVAYLVDLPRDAR